MKELDSPMLISLLLKFSDLTSQRLHFTLHSIVVLLDLWLIHSVSEIYESSDR